jgi:hypothetical protein
MRRVPRATTAVPIAALVLSLGTQCFAGAGMTAAQMACCAAADHDCGAAGAAEDCCRSEGGDQPQLVSSVQGLVPPPALVATTSLWLVRRPDTRMAALVFPAQTTRPSAGSPKYILLSSLLI